MAFVGWNGTWYGMKIRSDKVNATPEFTYEASCFAEKSGKRMNNLDYGANVVDYVAISVPVVFERRFSFRKYLEDIIGGAAVLELVCRRMFGEVYPGLLSITFQCGIEDGLKVGRGRGC